MQHGMSTLAQKVVLGAMVALVAACTGLAERHVGTGGVTAMAEALPADTPGPTVAQRLMERYDDTRTYCERASDNFDRLPAVLCSGILLRVTRRGVGYDVWNPNPLSSTPNGVPFSWLRQDSGFSRMAYGLTSGFIVMSRFDADDSADGYTPLTVRCVFPFDGATDGRITGDRDGCGQSGDLAETGPCQSQGIVAARQWLEKFGSGPLYGFQCAFRLLPGTPAAWQAFQAQTEIRHTLAARFVIHNEVVVGTWAQNDAKLPLEAFFYLNGDPAGLDEAKANQIDFRGRTGRWVPVIALILPAGPDEKAAISFNAADQGIQQ